ncbi:MAG: hypothetical protein RRY65_06210 [Pseudoflavonifractor sp.]
MKKTFEAHPLVGLLLSMLTLGGSMLAAVGAVTMAVVLPLSILLGL